MTTRKKTTTGTMGSKKKSTRADKATMADGSPVDTGGTAKKVAVAPEAKASEVIEAVPIALLATHAALPDRQELLSVFARHHLEARARHIELAARPEPEPEPEPVKPLKNQRAPLMPPTLPGPRPSVSLAAPPPAKPEVELTGSGPNAELVDEPPLVPVAPEAIGEALEERPTFAVDPLEDPLAAAEPDDSDDFFARLQAQGEAAVDGRSSMFEEMDFGVAVSSDQSSPFIVAPAAATDDLAPAEGRTTMMQAFDDDGLVEDELFAVSPRSDEEPAPLEVLEVAEDAAESPPAFAEPNDSTTMIQAVSDEDLEAAASSSEATPVAAGRKSRKASKKKRG
jgi:hypothetical protein